MAIILSFVLLCHIPIRWHRLGDDQSIVVRCQYHHIIKQVVPFTYKFLDLIYKFLCGLIKVIFYIVYKMLRVWQLCCPLYCYIIFLSDNIAWVKIRIQLLNSMTKQWTLVMFMNFNLHWHFVVEILEHNFSCCY